MSAHVHRRPAALVSPEGSPAEETLETVPRHSRNSYLQAQDIAVDLGMRLRKRLVIDTCNGSSKFDEGWQLIPSKRN